MTHDTAPDPATSVGYVRMLLAGLRGDDPDRVVLEQGDRTVRAAEVMDTVYRFARVLRAHGVGPGVGTAWLSMNSPEIFLCRVAVQLLGGRFVGLRAFYSTAQLAEVLAQADVQVFGNDPALAPFAAEVARQVPVPHRLGVGPVRGVPDLLELAAAESAEPFDPVPTDIDQPAVVYFTTGTVEKAKGVPWSYRKLDHWCECLHANFGPLPWRFMVFNPVTDVGGEFAMAAVSGGGTAVFVDGQLDAKGDLAELAARRISHTFLPSSVMNELATDPAAATADVSAMRRLLFGGQPAPMTHVRRALKTFGPVLVQIYGQQEAGLVCTVQLTSDAAAGDEELIRSVGEPLPRTEVRIEDPNTGEEVPTGVPGEICVRSPSVMTGYWRSPERSIAALRNGWLHTEDVGVRDAKGRITIVDRIRDMVIVRGFNVFSTQVEDTLTAHPDVARAAVVGVPYEESGEAVFAAVVLEPGATVGRAELRDRVAAHLGARHAPRYVHVVDEIPLLGVLAKPDKKVIREMARELVAAPDLERELAGA